MAYDKQTWVDNESVLSAARWNHMEDGIDTANRWGNIRDITVAAGVTAGDAVAFDGTEFIKTGEANYLFDGKDAIKLGLMPYTSVAADVGYTLYVQSDGSLGIEVTSTPCALILSETLIYVDFNPTKPNPKNYYGVMQGLLSMPGISAGKVRMKIHFPEDAGGAMLRYKLSGEWVEGDDETTGTLIATLTDDTNLYGDHLWYEADVSGGASDGNFIYIKCFPYVADMYNVTIGVNETACTVGILDTELHYDEISGTILTDTANSNDGINVNVITEIGKIGNCGNYNGVDAYTNINGVMDAAKLNANFSIEFWMNADVIGNNDTLIEFYQFKTIYAAFSGTYLNFVMYDGSSRIAQAPVTDSTWLHIVCTRDTVNGMKIYVNGSLEGSNTFTGNASGASTNSKIGMNYAGGAAYNGKIDQVRLYTGALTPTEIENLYNDGDGC